MSAARPVGGRRLVLLRHAKAEPAGSVADELRPLALAGRRQCGLVGVSLAASGLLPERVLVSSAVRTRQTWDLVRTGLGEVPEPEVDVDDALYLAHAADVVRLVQQTDARVATVLVVGHEPTMSGAAALLAAADDPADDPHDPLRSGHLAQVRTGLPTGAYAVLALDDWATVGTSGAMLLDVVRPHR